MEFEKARDFILDKQKNEFPSSLYYHNVGHVLDVYDAVLRHIELAHIGKEDSILLQTAALFHDSGFIIRAKGHEELSCDFARQYLPDYGYNNDQIEKICGMIMATRIPQTPHNYLEEVLADSDLDYLGRYDFYTISGRLYKELTESGVVAGDKEWDAIQVRFFEDHHYFTDVAKSLRQETKMKHFEYLKSKITPHN